jgi:hypothetical protein
MSVLAATRQWDVTAIANLGESSDPLVGLLQDLRLVRDRMPFFLYLRRRDIKKGAQELIEIPVANELSNGVRVRRCK